jgi:uncharacterized protein YprB with RNaseH-like and TPR domain
VKDELFAKLARLRREERAPPAAHADAAPLARDGAREDGDTAEGEALPAWLGAHLDARAARHAAGPRGSVGPPAELAEHENAHGTFTARARAYPAQHLHGDACIGEASATDASALAWLARDPALAGLALARCVYLDIETTGLSGGAGTVPFLVALGTFDGGGDGTFHLWQAFLRHPGEEAAALAEVAARIRAADGVVSFFGKSFDRHRLEDKMRVHRIAPPFGGKPHLDLYHPLARLYRGAFADTRLGTLERELCGVERGHDLPGSLAPAAWFDFLAERPHALEAVFRHNELDVLSLPALAVHLARARAELRPDGRALPGCGRARARALAELHARAGEHALALEWLERALTRPGSHDGELWFRHAEALRRLGERARALEEFERLARERRDLLGVRAWAEVLRLAKRLKRPELEAEARARGPELVERTLTGRARARALALYAARPPRKRAGAAAADVG